MSIIQDLPPISELFTTQTEGKRDSMRKTTYLTRSSEMTEKQPMTPVSLYQIQRQTELEELRRRSLTKNQSSVLKNAELSLDMKESRNFADFATKIREQVCSEKKRHFEAKQKLWSYRATESSILDRKNALDHLTYQSNRKLTLTTKQLIHDYTAKSTSELSEHKQSLYTRQKKKQQRNVRSLFFLSLDLSEIEERVRSDSHYTRFFSVASLPETNPSADDTVTTNSAVPTECNTDISHSSCSAELEAVDCVLLEGAESVSTFNSEPCSRPKNIISVSGLAFEKNVMGNLLDAYEDDNIGDRRQDECTTCVVI